MLTLTEEQLEQIKERIAKQSKVTTVRQMVPEREAVLSEKISRAVKKSLAQKQRPKRPRLRESQVMLSVQQILEAHPKVALYWRQNTGAARLTGGFYVKFSFKGASDWMGMLYGGRFLAVECKATGMKPSPDQRAFLANVERCGGLALCVDDPAVLQVALDAL